MKKKKLLIVLMIAGMVLCLSACANSCGNNEPEASTAPESPAVTAAAEPTPAPSAEPTAEPSAEPEAKPESQSASSPEPEAKPESQPEPASEPEPEPEAEPEPEPEPVSALSPEEQAYQKAERLLYVDGDYDAAFQLLQDWTDTEDASLQALIAECYRHGYGTEVNDRLAYDYYMRAAKQNDAIGLYGVATSIRSGYGVPRNQEYGTALLWKAMDASLEAAEESEDPIEQGRLYYQVGYPKMFYMNYSKADHQEAFAFLEKSAECGYPPAEYHVGRLYKGTETYTWYGLPILYLPEKDEALGDRYLELAQQHGLDITAKITDRYNRRAAAAALFRQVNTDQ